MSNRTAELLREVEGKPQFRAFKVNRDAINEDARTVELAFSSETGYERYFGVEILDHGKGSIRLDRLQDGAAFLVNHNTDDQVGVIESVEIGSDRIGRAVVRFGESARAEEIWRDVLTGIRKHISVGYFVYRMVLEEESSEGADIYRVTDWEPFEVSSVPVPADHSVGIGRSAEKNPAATEAVETETEIEVNEVETKAVPEIDINAEREKIRKSEESRQRKIDELGSTHGHAELAREFKANGRSVDEFKSAILERMGNSTPVQESPEIGMSNNEVREYSFLKAIRALDPNASADVRADAAFEIECGEAASKQSGRASQGIMVPYDVLTRDMTAGTNADGGYLVGTDHAAGSFIGMLYNSMKVREMGAQVMGGCVGDVAIPKLTAGHSAYWIAEDGAPSKSTPALGQLGFTPKTVGAYSDISRQLLLQSSPDAEGIVRGDIALTLGLGIDLACLHGSGSGGEPLGVAATSGVSVVAGSTNGLAPGSNHVIGLETAVAVDNADVGRSGYLTNARVRGKLKQTFPNSVGGDTAVWQSGQNGAGYMNGYRAEVSNQVKRDLTKGTSSGVCSAIFFSGAWDRLVIAMWGGLDLTVDPYSLSTTGQLRVVGLQSVDVGLRTPEAFSVMLDALTD